MATFNTDLDSGVDPSHYGILRTITTITPSVGDDDTITTDEGADIIIGGAASDSITAYLDAEVERDIVLGDNGNVTFEVDGSILTATTTDPAIGGVDTILTRNGSDIVIGGTAGDTIDAGTDASGDNEVDIVLGDSGTATFDSAGRLDTITSTATDIGGNDTIDTGGARDVVFGGTASDTIHTESGDDIVIGDSGLATFKSDITNNANYASVANYAQYPFSIVLELQTITPNLGGNDTIDSGAERDLVFGGTGDDTIFGGAGDDWLLGDHGIFDIRYAASTDIPVNQRVRSIYTTNSDGGGNDRIQGQDGDDILVGQQGHDILDGGKGEDDIIGGHNYLDGTAPIDRTGLISGDDTSDLIIGGEHADMILGDNGNITRFIVTTDEATLPSWNPVSQWQRYPDKFNQPATRNAYAADFDDVIRSYQRFDDIEASRVNFSTIDNYGSDWIFGDGFKNLTEIDALFASTPRSDWLTNEFITIFDEFTNITVTQLHGHDTLIGQRGDDIIFGNGGEDDIVGGHGSDHLSGGENHDTIIGDNGQILRRYLDIEKTHPITDRNTKWHRNVLIENQSHVTTTVSVETANRDQLLNTSRVILTIDSSDDLILVLTEPVNSDAGNDTIRGGDGDDFIIGQLGDDEIDGNDGSDYIIGDNANHNTASLQDIPTITYGLRLFNAPQNSTLLPENGQFISPRMEVLPEQFSFNSAYDLSTIDTHASSDETQQAMTAAENTTNIANIGAADLIPIATFIPQIHGHRLVLAGNDQISGGAGRDFIVGDNSLAITPILTGLNEINNVQDSVREELAYLSYSTRALVLDALQAYDPTSLAPLQIGQDTLFVQTDLLIDIESTNQNSIELGDVLVGDNNYEIIEIQQGFASNNTTSMIESILTSHDQVRTVFAKLEAKIHSLHADLLATTALASPTIPISVGIGNDIIDTNNSLISDSQATNMVTGDARVNIVDMPTTTRFTDSAVLLADVDHTAINNHYLTLQTVFHTLITDLSVFESVDTANLPATNPLTLTIGNDVLTGSQGRDIIVGDFSLSNSPIISSCLVQSAIESSNQPCPRSFSAVNTESITSLEVNAKVALAHSISNYLDDLVHYLDNISHSNSYLRLEEGLNERHTLIGNRGDQHQSLESGRDIISGGSADDMLIGDSETFYHEAVMSNTEELFRLFEIDSTDPNIPGFEAILRRQFITTNTDRELFEMSTSDSQADNISGQAGNDTIYGQFGDDTILGGIGTDALYGGSGIDSVESPENDIESKTNSTDGSNHLDRDDLTTLQQTDHTSTRDQTRTQAANLMLRRNQLEHKIDLNPTTGQITRTNRATKFIAADVSLDSLVSPIDALMVVNYLNQTGSGDLSLLNSHLNTNLDDAVTPIDALVIINILNLQ